MAYVPPHLRGGSGGSAPPPSRGSDRGGGGYERGGDRGGYGDRRGGSGRDYGGSFGGDRRGGYGEREGYGDRRGGYGDRDRGGKGGYGDRDGRRGDRSDRDSGPGGGDPDEPVFAPWEPSIRAKAMTEKMITEVRNRLNVTVEIPTGEDAASPPIESFDDMNLHANIMLDVRYHEYEKPTPIQSQAIPVALSGRNILGIAETGSGKTASFAIPLIQHCLGQPPLRRGDGPIGLVLAPTRELAQQIEKEVKLFSKSSKGVNATIVVGGTNMNEQRSDLKAGVEIVVATPGRLIDHLQQGNTTLGKVSYVVLDEADRMLDLGFEPQIREVLRGLNKKHQTLLFSATMPEEIEHLADDFLDKPVRIKVGTVSTPTANVSQHLEKTTDVNKIDRLLTIIMEEKAEAGKSYQQLPLTIVFVERKARCDEVADALCQEGIAACALHGGRSQGEREAALSDFRQGKTSVLVATDVASRGLDVTGIAHVINLDLPRSFEDYVHRIGRTGRAGTTGRATSLFTDRDSFLVAQIKHALAELEKGNTLAFATGKAARKKEREAAQAFRDGMKGGDEPAGIMVSEKYKHMSLGPTGAAANSTAGKADDAWDD
mmetsp:Transcript_13117/g.15863  ORF Transcript_13117/g.15863 Transcript_13117/m.15863 type:complete len:600 (-) Transcript_13117:184-1983(-)|eukprot:CAMPEP_0197854598 /NCGR_PEP_ID=MMETSP1438-20131217/24958_1 /TAXON_ID=1461541 /ORGANISM="Pterosperma sp., Strain CCMP1384" /LENGTH=599 /DNA_ID=CAMNT_0043469385 /DNA_START=70 /DNA_END=1869 /DNA_ORIENTATION=+